MNKINRMMKGLGTAVVLALALTSCTDDDYMRFDSSYNGIYFLKQHMEYSFGVSSLDVKTYTVNVPVRVMGNVTATNRPFDYEVLAINASGDTLPAREGEQYRIPQPVVMPDSVNAYLPVEVIRGGLEGDYENGYKRYRLVLRLKANNQFKPTLDSLSQQVVLTFDNAVDQPNWLDFRGDKVWSTKDYGVWHPLKYIKMVEFFHQLADIQPETYEKMVAAYGENLESIPYGDPYLFRTIMKKYIYIPMYNYFNDEANRQEILDAYPDFPFDFPNPVGK